MFEEKKTMKAKKSLLIVLLTSNLLIFGQNENLRTCNETISTKIYKDSTKNTFRYMEPSLKLDNTCNSKTFEIKNASLLDFSQVYDVSFFLNNKDQTTIKIAFITNEKISKNLEYKTEKDGANFHRFIIHSYDAENHIDFKNVNSILFTIESENTVVLDEIEFSYIANDTFADTQKYGLDKKQLKYIVEKNNTKQKEQGDAMKGKEKRDFDLR